MQFFTRVVSLPNLITIFRLFVAPFIIWAMFHKTNTGIIIAFTLFVLAAISDTIDGAVARSLKATSKVGAILDRTADKLLIVTTYLSMGFLDLIQKTDLIPIFIMVIRELALSGVREISEHKNFTISANFLGKIKTFTQILSICFIFASYFMSIFYFMVPWLLWGAAALAIISFFNYFISFIWKVYV